MTVFISSLRTVFASDAKTVVEKWKIDAVLEKI